MTEAKAHWVNLFKDNQKHEEGLKLQTFINKQDKVILDEIDSDDAESSWGFHLVGYFACSFRRKISFCSNFVTHGR